MYKLDLEKAAEPEIKLPTSTESQKKAREFQKKRSISTSLTRLKPLTLWITTSCGKFLERWEYQTTLLASWETCMWVKKQQVKTRHGTMDWFQSEKGEYIEALYCHHVCLIYMQSTSCEMLGWMNHNLESRLLGEISITSYIQIIPL